MKRLIKSKRMWGVLIAIALLAYCFKGITIRELESLFARVRYDFMALALVSAFLYAIFRALRWKVIISQQSKVGWTRCVVLYSAGQTVNIAMPMLTGQVGRLILLAKKLNLKKTFVFSTLLLEVLFDALSLILFMLATSLAFAFPDKYRVASIGVALATLLVLVLLYLILSYQLRIEEFCRRRLSTRWPGAYVTIKKSIRSFTKGINLLRSSQHVAVSMALSLLAWASHVLVIWFLFRAFGFDLPIPAAATVMIINTLVLMIPITPGNAGTFEIAVSTSLVAMKIGRSDAVLFALALHLLDLLPIIGTGLAFFHFEGVSFREIKAQHQDDAIFEKISEEGTYLEEDKT